MARTAAAGIWSRGRAFARAVQHCLGAPLLLSAGLLIALTSSGACQTEPVKGEAVFSAQGGYARLMIKLAEDVDSEVTAAGSILIIRFKRPVDVPVDKLSDAVPDYVGSARRDPDGSAIRLSLARRVTINTMAAGERLFVDLLPDSWSGQPPGLPAEVVRELSERARVAERALRVQRALAEAKKRAPIRVRASVQPTFVRFVFEMPDGVGVSSVLNDQKLTLLFNSVLNFDLADAKIAAPANVAAINQKIAGRNLRGGNRLDRRCRCPLVPRGQELRHRRRLPAAGKNGSVAAVGSGSLVCSGASRAGAGRRKGTRRAKVGCAGASIAGRGRKARRAARGVTAIRRDRAAEFGSDRQAGQDRDQARSRAEAVARGPGVGCCRCANGNARSRCGGAAETGRIRTAAGSQAIAGNGGR